MVTMRVKGMHCKSCSMLIREELEDLGASDIAIEMDASTRTGTVSYTADKDPAEVTAAIEALGDYRVER